MSAIKKKTARSDFQTSVQERLRQAGVTSSKCRGPRVRDGSTKTIQFPKHTELMQKLYGGTAPKVYAPWQGKSKTDLAWAAGLADGEAYIGAYWARPSQGQARNPSAILKVSINQNHLPTLVRFQEILQVHGQIRPASKTVQFNRPMFYLTYSNRHALEVMRRLQPYLVRKRPNVHMCEALFKKGRLGIKPGPDGHSIEVWEMRAAIIKALARLKSPN